LHASEILFVEKRLEQLTTRYCSCQVTWVVQSSSGNWQNSLNRHCTYVFIQFLTLHTPARIFSMLNVGSIRKKKDSSLPPFWKMGYAEWSMIRP